MNNCYCTLLNFFSSSETPMLIIVGLPCGQVKGLSARERSSRSPLIECIVSSSPPLIALLQAIVIIIFSLMSEILSDLPRLIKSSIKSFIRSLDFSRPKITGIVLTTNVSLPKVSIVNPYFGNSSRFDKCRFSA